MTFVEALGRELNARGLSKKDFAREANIPSSTIYSWFSARSSDPSVELARSAAYSLGTSIEGLVDKHTPGKVQPRTALRRQLDALLDKMDDTGYRILMGTANSYLGEQHAQDLQRDSMS